MNNNTLVVIPARGGSKGLPGKNIKPLAGKPLLHYTIDSARSFVADKDICLTTDSEEIIACANALHLSVPFIRPQHLSSDKAGSYDVMLHALSYYQQLGQSYDRLLLMQPTSPFRKPKHIIEVSELYHAGLDMVVSVGESSLNPYFNLFEENAEGFLEQSKQGNFSQRQDTPATYYYNGSLYLINTASLIRKKLTEFSRIKKYVMEEIYCQDIDTSLDWLTCEAILNHHLV